MSNPSPRVVVVGGGPAAHRVTEALLDGGHDGRRPVVTVITEEPHRPYDRVQLSQTVVDDVDLTLSDEVWERPEVLLSLGDRAERVDTAARTVTTRAGVVHPYDDLVIATGSDAARLTIPNADRSFVFRTLDDVAGMRAEVARVRERRGSVRALVVGGGLLGLEAAEGLVRLGAETGVVHSRDWLMSAQLDEGGGRALNTLIAEEGLVLHLGERPTAIRVVDGEVSALEFAGRDPLECDLVVVATGITPRDELADSAGLERHARGGIVVDETCATSVEHVWAIGEVASYRDERAGLVAPANAMAEVAADRILGGSATFDGFDTACKLKLSGVEVASFGDCFARTPGALEVVYADPARGLYQKVVTSGDAGTLLGGIFVGDASPYNALRPLLNHELPGEPGAYLSTPGGEAPATELPDDAVLCSCNNVTAGTVRRVVADGVTDIADVKACTRAGTQCGSCVQMLKKTIDQTLVANGIEVSRALCEHFAMPRAELFQAVRGAALQTWDEVLARFGTGLGCDVCKPVVASILAGQPGAYVLDGGRAGLQDTNDRHLANMQKNGTYSVVPRIPAGEITPDGLVTIGLIAKKYGLYTKITGGQRIDMFGARLDQLPDIWAELLDAGFESGQAYGKSLRTVKSCVGSTWCRYGVLDSVGMAIRLELRYRGLRSPHKIKMGVSGCARECAEAQAKDVGVIATADGWNLYVGGNGGANPVHATLLAQGLDDDTLIRYVDRYVMYYLRTADRLQRTARWQEELPGGIDHVREVVVDDTLGICDELERDMQQHVDGYADEWAETLADPQRLRRFRPFVNSAEPVDERQYVIERGQPRPASEDEVAQGGPRLVAGPQLPVRLADAPAGGPARQAG